MLVHGSRRFSFQKSVTCIDEDVCITKSVSMDQAQVIDWEAGECFYFTFHCKFYSPI